MRSVAASMRGLYLRSWRYDSQTERLAAEASEREYWSPEKWKTWQEDRLSFVLHRAVTRVPYYRDQWAERRRCGDRASWEYIENWPILEKEPLRKNPKRFVANDCDVRRMFHEHTSGTTGKSLDLWWSKDTVRSWYALFEARCRHWYGLSRHDRWAMLGGQLVTAAHRRHPPFWVWNAALNQLYMSSYHLAPNFLPYYLDALLRYRIKYLLGYTSSLYELAQEALRRRRRDLKITVAFTNAEPVFDYQRQAIEEAFGCPVCETYGMAEIVANASECQAGTSHLWPEVTWLEVGEGDQPTPRGTSGDLITTGLLNADMPLIRYRVGDRGTLPTTESLCACERTLPMLASVEGRADDVLYAPDGRRIGRLDPVFKSNLAVHEAQVIQEALDRVRVRYVPTSDFTLETGRSITERLQARMGDVKVVLERVDEVPRGVNGKFRAVICNLPPEVRRDVEKTTQ
jgi:phenylacetate-CoA ligase